IAYALQRSEEETGRRSTISGSTKSRGITDAAAVSRVDDAAAHHAIIRILQRRRMVVCGPRDYRTRVLAHRPNSPKMTNRVHSRDFAARPVNRFSGLPSSPR